MTGSGSPCGACKFLRRKCVRGCVFAPYFCHEQGAAHFAAIHKVFGASNVAKLLANIPVSDRCEAAVTISYEAQARLQDPIYGCVSHIFALQQQVFSLQAQLASLKEQAAQGPPGMRSINIERVSTAQQLLDMHNWPHLNNGTTSSLPQFSLDDIGNVTNYHGNFSMESSSNNSMGDYKNVSMLLPEDNASFGSFEDGSSKSPDMQATGNTQWSFRNSGDEFESVAYDYAGNW